MFLECEIALRDSVVVEAIGSLADDVGFGDRMSTEVFCTTMDSTKGPTNRCLHHVWHTLYLAVSWYPENTSPRIILSILDDLSN